MFNTHVQSSLTYDFLIWEETQAFLRLLWKEVILQTVEHGYVGLSVLGLKQRTDFGPCPNSGFESLLHYFLATLSNLS